MALSSVFLRNPSNNVTCGKRRCSKGFGQQKSPTPGLRMNPPIKVGARSMLQSFRINGHESLHPHAI